MCGIVGYIGNRQALPILMAGLRRLEYRGYDSAGVALLGGGAIRIKKTSGRISALEEILDKLNSSETIGIGHTRWATHGEPNTTNAHPHPDCTGKIAVVHNGIIENYGTQKKWLQNEGVEFVSETDTEVIAHLVHHELKTVSTLLDAVTAAKAKLHGAYALCVIHTDEPSKIIATRMGSPLVIGVGIDEHYLASDQLALLQVTDRFIFLEEGDIAEVSRETLTIRDHAGTVVTREAVLYEHGHDSADKGEFRHYMMKEIYEQPKESRLQWRGVFLSIVY